MNYLPSRFALAALCLALVTPALAPAQESANDPPKIDPDAMSALRKMGDYLRTLDQFQVSAAITSEEVLEDSQKVQIAKQIDLVADRPSRVRVQVKSDKHERLLVFDGNSFTLFAPRMKYYATVAAPANIADLAKRLEDNHGIELPLVDLFRWGTADAQLAAITAAKDLGPSQCAGVTCQHYAFRQPGLDWEIWIQNGEFPLPRRLVLTTRTDEARPQYTAAYTWNLAPSFDDQAFVFVPPQDSKKIPLADFTAKASVRTNGRD
jgi:hypothetical protein